MKNTFRILPVIVLSLALAITVHAEQVHLKSGSTSIIKSTAAGCLPGANFKYLELNNVRTRINTGGDMWWDFENAQYEIPKGSKKMSMFSAALWIGGIDANGQLKLAAHRYRQVGVDYWPGPLTTDGTAAVTEQTCAAYDKMWYITRQEVDDFLAAYDDPAIWETYKNTIPTSITNWPAHGDVTLGQSYYLAPFFDRDADGDYNPLNGDYPYYDVSNELCHTKTSTAEGNGILVDQVIKGDATLWWVFNDKGNIHTETSGQPIGFEIRAQAFAFATNDEINDMTFYSYEIINRSTYRLTNTYFSQWVDTDLGYANDDYVGCDVMRGLGYCYNGTPKDGNGQAWAYGEQPPAIGVDFFQGPYIDNDGFDNPSFKTDASKLGPSYNGDCDIVFQDSTYQRLPNGAGDSIYTFVNAAAINGVNFGNGIIDDERFGMRRFVYHNNSNSGVPSYMWDPDVASQYYQFLRGFWRDNTQMLYGGNAHISSGATGPACYFMFPNETDICNWGTRGLVPNPKKWTEVTAGNQPQDRRFMESAGPFTLEPGAVNYITVGIPWARAVSGGPEASVKLLQSVDDKCQMLFDNCFKVISGPNAPDLTIRELENKLIVYISNRKSNDAGNNFHEGYSELDPRIQPPPGELWDPYYKFEGYKVYQLKNSNVTIADIENDELARQVFQCDVKNGVSRLVNFTFDQLLGASVPTEEVNGSNQGIVHSFELTKDAFTGNDLVNHIQYYYLAVAYAHNNYKDFIPTVAENLNGQKQPYLPGRKNIKVYTGIPHVPIGPAAIKGDYGQEVEITRTSGQGNGGNILDLSDETIAEILSKNPTDSNNVYGSPNYPIAYNAKYKLGYGPIKVKVIDPLNVKDGNYTVALDSMFNVLVPVGSRDTAMPTTRWRLIDNQTGTVYRSDTTIDLQNEQLFIDLGVSVMMSQTLYPGIYEPESGKYAPILPNNGIQEGSVEYADPENPWLFFIPDIDGGGALNWIRSGNQTADDARENDWDAPDKPFDPDQNYEKLLGGTWSPYLLVASSKQDTAGLAYGEPIAKLSKNSSYFSDLASVDIVFTDDKSKWTRCPVIEMCPYSDLAEGNAKQFDLRAHRSVNQEGDTNVSNTDPAMNSDYISTHGMGWFPGYAINIETGERLNMIFGEDSHLTADNGNDMIFNPTSTVFDDQGKAVFGGKHYLYIMSHTSGKEKRISLPPTSPIKAEDLNFPAYDAGAFFVKEMKRAFTVAVYAKQLRAYLFGNAMWTSIPMANPASPWLSSDVKIKLRITKPYARYYSEPMTGAFVANHNQNDFWPMYNFSTKAVTTVTDSTEKSVSDLDKINIVPNPYNGYSPYEVNQLDNRVKIVNLPQRCTITIYSTGGSVIRTFNKDESKTYIDWDLKNFAGIPVAGGVYIIHVKVPDVGEKVIKWFGAMRPIDLNAF